VETSKSDYSGKKTCLALPEVRLSGEGVPSAGGTKKSVAGEWEILRINKTPEEGTDTFLTLETTLGIGQAPCQISVIVFTPIKTQPRHIQKVCSTRKKP